MELDGFSYYFFKVQRVRIKEGFPGQRAKSWRLEKGHGIVLAPRVFHRYQANQDQLRFLTRLKLHRACELLKTTDLSMQEVAQEIGFNDQFYFSRLFRRHLRMAPTAYRQEFFPMR